MDDLLNIDNPYFFFNVHMVNHLMCLWLIMRLDKANALDTEAPFLDLHIFVSNGYISIKNMTSLMNLILT